MSWLKENWFKVSIATLGTLLVFSMHTYLRDKNEIEARTNRANCLAKSEELTGGGRLSKTAPCTDIFNYKDR